MQVFFLLYHCFKAIEVYNAIRLNIAAYVWMTGFGNFSYYYVRKDFSAPRFWQMMWRLNFFVFFTCLVMRDDYTLYYICPCTRYPRSSCTSTWCTRTATTTKASWRRKCSRARISCTCCGKCRVCSVFVFKLFEFFAEVYGPDQTRR